MARCRAACLALLLLFGAVPVLAQTRPSPIPEDTRRGYIRHVEEMAVTVDDKAMQLAAGATVRNQQNLIIVPMSIPRGGAWADYVLDRDGQVLRVWLLTPDELARPRPGGR
ncbi:MAG TPA: hypothetical protein VE034_07905, partial [Burkholderiales bacterium]|nr:hypothetical protein [Burkholderiales bacterium]